MGKDAVRGRNLFNGDTCTYFYNPEKWQPEGGPYSAKAIHRFVEQLATGGVDTFLINSCTQRAWYPSRTMPTILEGYRRGDREYFRGHLPNAGLSDDGSERTERALDNWAAFYNRYLDLIDEGTDWLAETSRACRLHGIAPWVSIRMNDMHGFLDPEASFFNAPIYLQDDMRLSRSAYAPGITHERSTHGLDYGRREVRDFMFGFIREAVEDYDFEGLELDWLRNPLALEPDASAETRQELAEWVGSIRALTEKRARETGKPYPLGLRLPGNWRMMASIGVDVQGWTARGWFDWIAVGGFLQTTWDVPHDELWREFGDRVAVYGVVENHVNWIQVRTEDGRTGGRRVSASAEAMAGNAAGKLALGADGIEWFNFFTTDQAREPGSSSHYGLLRMAESLDSLRGRDKLYAFSTVIDAPRFYPTSLYPFDATEQLPALLKPEWRRSFRLPMCAEPNDGTKRELVVQVVVSRMAERPLLGVSFNGSWPMFAAAETDRLPFPVGDYVLHAEGNIAYEFRFEAAAIQEGWNDIVLFNGNRGSGVEQWIEIVSMEAAVRKLPSRQQ